MQLISETIPMWLFGFPVIAYPLVVLLETKERLLLKEENIMKKLKRLSQNDFRMLDYSKILEDVLNRNDFWIIGKNVSRIDALEKVLGKTQYTADYLIQGMLHIKVARSTHAHALVKKIEKKNALKLDGVIRIVTADDIPGINEIGYYLPDQPLLVKDEARFIGDPIALVVAKDEYAAERGMDALEIEYEPLPAVFDPREALKPEAPKLHEKGNLAGSVHVRKGDVQVGFEKSEYIVEHDYETQHQDHAYLETEAAIGIPERDGRLTVIGTLQNPFSVKEKVASVLGWGQNRIRVIAPYLGGGFGGKDTMGPIICAQAAVAAALTGKPAMLKFSRDESIIAHGKRIPFNIKYKSGVAKDGKLTAVEAELIANVGGYAGQGTALLKRAVIHGTGPYEVPAVHIEGKAVYTNKIFAAALNGFGNPQTQFAVESQMDELAEKLQMDPLEFRLKNVLRPGSRTGTNQLLDHSVGIEEALSKLMKVSDWKKKRGEFNKGAEANGRKGIGVACSWHGNGTTGVKQDYASASIILNLDGTVTCRTETVEIGQGTHTGDAMITAEVLGVSLNRIRVEYPDTSTLPEGGQTHAQRGLTIGGTAVADAAVKLRRKLNTLASELLKCSEKEVEIKDGLAFSKKLPSKTIRFEELVKNLYARGICPAEYGFIKSPREDIDPETGLGNPYASFTFGCCVAEVAVDTETGVVTVLRVSGGLDAGKAINPEFVQFQFHGCATMGMGYALMENAQPIKGAIINPNLTDYIVPTIADKPEMSDLVIVEHPFRHSVFGAKGVGEIALIATPPAISNAIYNAVGVRIRELPITSDKVYFALKKRVNQ